MKNLAKVLAMALLVGLFGVVAVQSLLATPSVQTPLVATTSYNVATGIRWNEGLGVFEVFNASGISYIASNHYFNAIGEKEDKDESSVDPAYIKADGSKTYNIMQDIAYNPSDTDNQETAFKAGTRHSITTGAVNGRGFILKNFPVVASDTAGTALFRENAGTIQNLILENPAYSTGTSNTGILVYKNTGVIDGCEVIGSAINQSAVAINIASIAYESEGTIRNCTNRLNISTQGLYAAGIVIDGKNSNLVSNRNYGIISSSNAQSYAGGIAATMTLGEAIDNTNYADITANDAGGILGTCAGTTVKGNKNLGNITGANTACGIVGGIVVSITQSGNSNNGDLSSLRTDPINLSEVDENGIFYTPSVGMGNNVFMITNMIGLSYISSDVYFDTADKSYPKTHQNQQKQAQITQPTL